MQLLDHVSISVHSIDAVRCFYESTMSALGVTEVFDQSGAIGFGNRFTPLQTIHTCKPTKGKAASTVGEAIAQSTGSHS